MAGEIYYGIPGIIGATIIIGMLALVVRYLSPGHQRTALMLLLVASFTYAIGDGLARLAAVSGDLEAASAWFTIRFYGLALVPPALVHLAGSSTGKWGHLWFGPALALLYTTSLVGILVRSGTRLIIEHVEIQGQTLVAATGPGFVPFGFYGLATSLLASALFLQKARDAATAGARASARASGTAVLFPFSAAFLYVMASGQRTSPTFDPVVPFLAGAVVVLAGAALSREVPTTTLAAIRTIFASLPDGIVIADRRGTVRFSNPAANIMLAASGPGLEGEPLRSGIERAGLPPEARTKLQEALGRVEKGEVPTVTFSIEVPGPPSRAFRVVVAAAEVGGGPRGAVVDRFLFMAIHEETEARSREIMLSRASDVKDLFISMIGHDLKAPLSAIAGYGELIALDSQGSKDGLAMYRYSQSILASARQIQLMMENARLFSRLVDPQEIMRSRSPVDLPALVQKEAQNLVQAAERKGVTVEVAVEPGADGVRVFAAPILRSVFQNLIDNAVKYTADKSKVRVRITREATTALVEVEDEGPGIPADKREAVFRRFTRLEQTRTKTEGLGLGLAIARQLVELHGGTVAAVDRPGGQKGACFRVRLPLDAAPPLAEPSASP